FDFVKLLPPDVAALVLDGFHRALTISIGNSIWLGVAASVVALGTAFFLKEIPLRTTRGATSAATAGARGRAQPTPAAD
ncbi:MAG TPA: hypothetical protein VIF63_05760, partial [Candidatus Limnocylindrales bacterium]